MFGVECIAGRCFSAVQAVLKRPHLQTIRMFSVPPATELNTVALAYDDMNSEKTNPNLSPLVIAHGMLGSRNNWTSLSKAIHQKTGRRVICLDARNHGDSPHVPTMSYQEMAADMERLINELNLGRVSLMGHSMGGRTVMMLTRLPTKLSLDKVVVVDISPLNKDFDTTSSTEWNMDHFFHCLKDVKFNQGVSISQARKDADKQMALRISDPGLRAWLLMNMRQDPKTGEIGWRINVDYIHNAFRNDIAKINFPPNSHPTYDGPVLFVGGADSDYIPPTDEEEIKEIFPAAQLKYIPGAGHWVHSQKPAEFLDVVLPYLNS